MGEAGASPLWIKLAKGEPPICFTPDEIRTLVFALFIYRQERAAGRAGQPDWPEEEADILRLSCRFALALEAAGYPKGLAWEPVPDSEKR